MSTPTTASPLPTRRVPAMGGINPVLIRLELLRLVRNRRTMIFAVVLPVAFYFLFGPGQSYSDESVGNGNTTAYVMISMAIYGSMLSTTGGGAAVSLERSLGWSRQLRLTPLRPTAYISVKVIAAMALGAISIVVTFIAGTLTGAQMDSPLLWVACALVGWVGSVVFAAFGVFMGYLLPGDNVMQILGPGLALLAFLGGLFVPLDQMGDTFQTIAKFTPMYGLSELAHAPVTGVSPAWTAYANVLIWLVVFAGGAAWRFSKDTARV